MQFELLDHPADIGFRARAATLSALFATCAHALVSLILDPSHITPAERFPLSAGGNDYESLLVNWLNEVLYFIDGKHIAFCTFDVSTLNSTFIECSAAGEARDARKHPPRLVVKAVTYHQLRLQQTQDGYVAEVYVDV